MVRVISVHHFVKQDLLTLEKAGGKGVSRGKNDLLFLGGEHSVDVYDLNEGKFVSSFPTVDLVQQLVFCFIGEFLCTLESKSGEYDGSHTYVRVYLNWELETADQPMKARIAGRVTPASQAGSNSLEMVEIPVHSPAQFISCCQTTGNIAVNLGSSLSIYHFCQKVHDLSKVAFIDFDEILNVELGFSISEVAIAEDIVGCVSATEAHVFQIVINDSLLKNTTKESSHMSHSSDRRSKSRSKSKTRSVSESPGRTSVSSMAPFRGQKSIQKEVSPQTVREAENYVDLSTLTWVPRASHAYRNAPCLDDRFILFPTLVGASKCGAVTEGGETVGPLSSRLCSAVGIKCLSEKNDGQQVFEAVTLLHRRADSLSDAGAPFSNLHLSCIHDANSSGETASPHASSHPLLPTFDARGLQKSGVSIFLTLPHVGYVYYVTLASDPYENTVVRGGSFSYTAPVSSVAIEPSLLHALTLTGLETYMLRPHPHLVASHVPVDMIVPPHWEDSVCLVGLRPFLNVESLALTNSCLALIAASEEGSESSCTIYSLHLPNAADLYNEIVRIAVSHRSTGSTSYLHLLLEAHLVLLTALKHNLPDKENIEMLLQESCGLLADYYASCDKEVEWNQAVYFYHAAKLTPDAVLQRLDPSCPGLVHILLTLLMKKNAPVLTLEQANLVIDTLESVAPHEVSGLIMKSVCFKDYKKEKVLSVLKKRLSETSSDPSPTDVLALACILLEKGLHDQVPTVLSLVKPHQLVEALMTNSRMLLVREENSLCLSPFCQVLVEHKTDIFTEVLVLLIGEGTLSLDAFVDAYISVYPIVSCEVECNVNSLRLRDFLEHFFMEYGHLPELVEQKGNYQKAISVLVSLYLASLLGAFNTQIGEAQTAEQRSACVNLFCSRPLYLNFLPPFTGKPPAATCSKRNGVGEAHQGITSECSSEEPICTCRICNIHLLALQSLLSSELPSEDDCKTVYKFAMSNTGVVGTASLEVLCLPPAERSRFLLDNHPQSLLQYCKDTYKSCGEWQPIISLLMENKDICTEGSAQAEEIKQVLNDILNDLVMNSTCETFIHLIPSDKYGEYRTHIRQAHSAGLAQYLKNSFIKYAEKVLDIMS